MPTVPQLVLLNPRHHLLLNAVHMRKEAVLLFIHRLRFDVGCHRVGRMPHMFGGVDVDVAISSPIRVPRVLHNPILFNVVVAHTTARGRVSSGHTCRR